MCLKNRRIDVQRFVGWAPSYICHGLCIPSFIGWTFLNESTTNSVCSCTDARTTKLLGTWRTTAHQYPTLPIVNGYVLPVVMKSLFHGTGSVPMDVGHLLLLARLSGTLCPRTCVIRMFLRTVTGSHWRRFYFRSTGVFSALEVFFYENALYKFTFDIDICWCHNLNLRINSHFGNRSLVSQALVCTQLPVHLATDPHSGWSLYSHWSAYNRWSTYSHRSKCGHLLIHIRPLICVPGTVCWLLQLCLA